MEKTLVQITTDCVKVVLYGPESSGKSTLSQALADHYNTAYVPEYARLYLQDKWDRKSEICTQEDLIPITRGQIQLENEGLKNKTINDIFKEFSKNNYKYDEKEILDNKENFFNSVFLKSFFETKKIIIILRASDKIVNVMEEILEKNIEDTKLILE